MPRRTWGAEGTAVTFQAQGQQRRLPPELETTVFRIAQEAINNVKNHAHAGAVSIVLRWEPRQIALSVHDDGRGFDVQGAYHPLEAGSGIGLLGMRERAEMFAGHLTIRSDPGEGTSVEVCLPVAGEETGNDNPGADC